MRTSLKVFFGIKQDQLLIKLVDSWWRKFERLWGYFWFIHVSFKDPSLGPSGYSFCSVLAASLLQISCTHFSPNLISVCCSKKAGVRSSIVLHQCFVCTSFWGNLSSCFTLCLTHLTVLFVRLLCLVCTLTLREPCKNLVCSCLL